MKNVFLIILIIVFALFLSNKPRAHKSKSKRTNKKVGKIYYTTEGFFADNSSKKKRNVVILEQRKLDGAVAVAKIEKYEGKKLHHFVPNLTLDPKKHKSLKEKSLVHTQPQWGVTRNKATERRHKPIYLRDLQRTKDKLTKNELKKVKEGMYYSNSKMYNDVREKWENGFKK